MRWERDNFPTHKEFGILSQNRNFDIHPACVVVLSHEVGEWMNDPTGANTSSSTVSPPPPVPMDRHLFRVQEDSHPIGIPDSAYSEPNRIAATDLVYGRRSARKILTVRGSAAFQVQIHLFMRLWANVYRLIKRDEHSFGHTFVVCCGRCLSG